MSISHVIHTHKRAERRARNIAGAEALAVARRPEVASREDFWGVYLSYHTTHTTKAERRAEKQRQRRSASSGQSTKRGIEGEDPAAAGIEGFFSLKGPRFVFGVFALGGAHHHRLRSGGLSLRVPHNYTHI